MKNRVIGFLNSEYFMRRQYRNMDLFDNIEIETINRCNGICPFCPVNSKENQRPYARMSKDLLYKIIDELSSIDYSGSISLYSNNEPFLDKRIIDFYAYARRSLPEAYVFIYTNGSLLSLTKFLKIIPHLDKIIINNYDDDRKMHPNATKIYSYIKEHIELKDKVEISMIPLNQIRTSRGGQAPNKGKQKAPRIKCTLPFRQIIIRPDGKVSLCSNDALGVYTLGDAKRNTVKEIWEGAKFRKIRKEILTNGRKNLRLCQDCDNVSVSKIVSDHISTKL